MMQITGRRTVPQIFIGDTHVGGCDDLIALDRRGGLMPLLQTEPRAGPTIRLAIIAAPAARARRLGGHSFDPKDIAMADDNQQPRFPDPARLPEGPVAGAAEFPRDPARAGPAQVDIQLAWAPSRSPTACTKSP